MKNLAKITDKEIQGRYIKIENPVHRTAARAIIRDTDGNIALLFVSKKDFYKLPGGGAEEGETVLEALNREVMEEVGCQIKVMDEVGVITEERGDLGLTQTSYCYIADVVGEKMAVNFDKYELADGYELLWVSANEVLEAFHGANTDEVNSRFITMRELMFFEEALKKL